MNSKLIGGILLIAGTCIGGGMLGLPIATAQGGLFFSSVLFVVCWMLMAFTALLTLEVNLCFPKNSNIISMARKTLGKPAEMICWTVYLFFLYSLVAAYIAGGQDILRGLLQSLGVDWPASLAGTVFVLVFGAIVSLGTQSVDLFNRIMMVIKFGSLFILMSLIAVHVEPSRFAVGEPRYLLPALTVVVTSFGFSIIVPSLRAYFHDDVRQLRLAIILGSFLPLLCYLAWEAAIFGAVPLDGASGLASLMQSDQPVSGLMQAISIHIPADTVVLLTKLFTSICVLTAFVCVSLSLSHYLADGMHMDWIGTTKYFIILMTFLPPLLIAVLYPRAFISFLSIAGLCCVLLQAFMPALMAWQVRYKQRLPMTYQVCGGKSALVLSMIVSLLIVLVSGFYLF